MRRSRFLLATLLLASVAAGAQSGASARSSVTFDLFWEAATPQRYRITVDDSGSARYESHTPGRPAEGRSSAPSEPDDFETAITVSGTLVEQIFQIARELDYFNGDWDYKKHAIANTGKKTFTYADSVRKFQTTCNYSENKSMQKITAIFEGISLTLEHGRKLQFLLRFDKLGLESELSGMEDMAARNDLYELHLIAPVLRKIAGDTRILHLARQRAERLLAAGEATPDSGGK